MQGIAGAQLTMWAANRGRRGILLCTAPRLAKAVGPWLEVRAEAREQTVEIVRAAAAK